MCQQAYEQGARFAKWRNVLQLDPAKQMPTELAIADCVHTLARYASIAQSEGMDTLADHFCFFLKRGCMLGVAAFFYKKQFSRSERRLGAYCGARNRSQWPLVTSQLGLGLGGLGEHDLELF